MIRKSASVTPGYVCVAFELPSCLWADRIFLVGDFNGWNETATPMKQDRDGIWRATVELPQGTVYEFRYLIDGQWTSDSHADGFVENSFGVSNSVVNATVPVVALPTVESQIHELASRHPMRPNQGVSHRQSHLRLRPETPVATAGHRQRVAA
jgi:hypothetical protein